MGALRRTIEETVAKKLFKGVVSRWEDRIMVTKLPTIMWDPSLADEMSRTFEELSRFIEGHTHTEERKRRRAPRSSNTRRLHYSC